jgi:hypothetical protein
MKQLTLFALSVSFLSACTLGLPASSEGASAPAAATVELPLPATSTAVLPTATPATYRPVTVTTWADNVLLRSNPGYLFPQLAVLRKGSVLLAFARSPGSEWLFARTASNTAGWVFVQLVDAGGSDIHELPAVVPADAQEVRGTVTDLAGVPISGIQFSLVQGAGNNAPRNDALTDATGQFYAFMPQDATGTWTVGYTAVACTSNTMDANCNCIGDHCGKPDPLITNITLPRPEEDALTFTWR